MSCGKKYACNRYLPVPVEGWEARDTVSIAIDPIRESGNYEFSVGVRSTRQYPYQYLWILTDLELIHPDTLIVDTLVCSITDAQGEFLGKGLSVYDNVYPLATIYCKKGQYGRMKLRHIMRRDPLPGISDLGVSISRTL